MSLNVNTAAGSSGTGVQFSNGILDVWSKEILFQAQPALRFESVAQIRQELNVLPGSTIKFLKYSSLTGGSALTENVAMNTDTLSTSVIPITVVEQGKAVSFSEFLLRSSFLNIMENAATLLGMHYAKNRDGIIRDALLAGTNVQYSQKGGTAAARADLTAASTFDLNTVRAGVEFLATNKAPKINGDAYIGFVHPHQARFLRADPAWINVANYAAPENMLNGEIGRIEDVRFIETTQVPYILINTQNIYIDGTASGTTTSIAANASTSVYQAIMLGDYAVGLGESLPVEMRDNGVVDFGRTHALAYYGIWGAGIIEAGHSLVIETA